MEIKDFIKESIMQITHGITDANKEIQNEGAYVASSVLKDANGFPIVGELYSDDRNGQKHIIRNIDLETVSVSDSTQTGGKGTLQVVSFLRADGEIENNFSSTSLNKIKFSLPLAMPI